MVKNVVRSLIVGFGFLNGIWFGIGVSPEDEIISLLQPIVMKMPDLVKMAFTWIPVILTIMTILTLLKIYTNGGIMGAAAVLLAFFSGAIIFKIPIISIVLLLIAYIIGLGVFKKK